MKHLIFFLILLPNVCMSQLDTSRINKLEEKYTTLSSKLEEVKRDENNYSIEKNLLKETYSNNFDRINLVITAILGIFGVLTFFGIRDINSIKKEYKEELEKLRSLQLEIAAKSKEFESSKKKYDEEITGILKQNEEQNNKIKVLELKEKITNLFNEKKFGTALEFCAVALELSPNDIVLLNEKGKILGKLSRFNEAIDSYEKVLTIDPINSGAIVNLTEIYLFKNQPEKADAFILKHPSYFNNEKRDISVLDFFSLIKQYHANDIAGMKEYAKNIIDKQNPDNQKVFRGWDVTDALTFAFHEEESERKLTLRRILFYLNGQVKGTDLDKALQLNLFPA